MKKVIFIILKKYLHKIYARCLIRVNFLDVVRINASFS